MTTFNTGNPIGSTDARDRSDNSENLDFAVNSLSPTFVDRLGVTRDTLEGVYQKSAYYRAGTFDAGYTLTNNRQTLAYGNVEYSWSGAFPKVVPAGSTPETTGGVGAGAWVDRTDVTLRSDINVVTKKFSNVAQMKAGVQLGDEGKYVSWISYHDGWAVTGVSGGNSGLVVPAGTGIADDGSLFDTDSGLQVKALFDGSVSAEQFGCRDQTDCTAQLVNLGKYVNGIGGKLTFKSGNTYYYTNHKDDTDTSYYGHSPVFSFSGLDGLFIDGAGCTLKALDGSKFGSFDPVTGASHSPSLPFWDVAYSASPGTVWYFIDCENISGFLPDGHGNNTNFTLGGSFGDTGRQIQATYIRITGASKNFNLYNPKAHYMGLDGIAIKVETEESAESSEINIYGGSFEYSGRNNLSLSGGARVSFYNSKFNHAASGAVASSPQAGVDIEPELGYWVVNPLFKNCEFINNGVSCATIYAPSGYVKNVTFEDSTFWGCRGAAVYAQHGADTKFVRCRIHGKITHSKNCRFIDCDIDDIAHPLHGIYKNGLYIVDDGTSAVFDNTRISTTQYRGPKGGSFINKSKVTCGWDSSESATGGTAMVIDGFCEGLTVVDALTGAFNDTSRYYVTTSSESFGVNALTISGSGNGLRHSSRTGNYGEISLSKFTGLAELSVKSDVAGTSTRILGARSSIPTSGAFLVGDMYFKTTPVAGGYIGWVCTAAGTPGTWKTFGTISA